MENKVFLPVNKINLIVIVMQIERLHIYSKYAFISYTFTLPSTRNFFISFNICVIWTNLTVFNFVS